jgi:hypothetical protein
LNTEKYQWPGDILRDADIAMYRAKALGKARYEVFTSSMHTRAVALMNLENDLRESVEELNLKVFDSEFGRWGGGGKLVAGRNRSEVGASEIAIGYF